jgi:hypothetical protein
MSFAPIFLFALVGGGFCILVLYRLLKRIETRAVRIVLWGLIVFIVLFALTPVLGSFYYNIFGSGVFRFLSWFEPLLSIFGLAVVVIGAWRGFMRVIRSGTGGSASAGGLYGITLLAELPGALVRFITFFLLIAWVTFLPVFVVLMTEVSSAVSNFSLFGNNRGIGSGGSNILEGWLTLCLILAAISAFGMMLVSLLSFWGLRSGASFTRFVLGAREMSTREKDVYLGALKEVAGRANKRMKGFTGPYVVDSGPLGQTYTIGSTLYLSGASLRSDDLPLFLAHEVGLQQRRVGGVVHGLRSLVFPLFYLFVGRVRNWSTGAGSAPPEGSLEAVVQEASSGLSATDTFYSIVNALMFFNMALFGGGLGVWLTSPLWAKYFREEAYKADEFVLVLGWRSELREHLEQGIFYDTSVPYMMAWQPANELRIDRIIQEGAGK